MTSHPPSPPESPLWIQKAAEEIALNVGRLDYAASFARTIQKHAPPSQEERLRKALLGVRSTWRAPEAMCWCGAARDVKNYGHEERCVEARAALKEGEADGR